MHCIAFHAANKAHNTCILEQSARSYKLNCNVGLAFRQSSLLSSQNAWTLIRINVTLRTRDIIHLSKWIPNVHIHTSVLRCLARSVCIYFLQYTACLLSAANGSDFRSVYFFCPCTVLELSCFLSCFLAKNQTYSLDQKYYINLIRCIQGALMHILKLLYTNCYKNIFNINIEMS